MRFGLRHVRSVLFVHTQVPTALNTKFPHWNPKQQTITPAIFDGRTYDQPGPGFWKDYEADMTRELRPVPKGCEGGDLLSCRWPEVAVIRRNMYLAVNEDIPDAEKVKLLAVMIRALGTVQMDVCQSKCLQTNIQSTESVASITCLLCPELNTSDFVAPNPTLRTFVYLLSRNSRFGPLTLFRSPPT